MYEEKYGEDAQEAYGAEKFAEVYEPFLNRRKLTLQLNQKTQQIPKIRYDHLIRGITSTIPSLLFDPPNKKYGNNLAEASNPRNPTLNLSDSNITLVGLQGVGLLTHLTTLDLSFNNLSDVSPLRGLNNLTALDLNWNNNLSDISALAGLTNLTTLNLGYNDNLSDVSPLSSLTNLTTLNLLYNKELKSADVDVLDKALPNTKIIWGTW